MSPQVALTEVESRLVTQSHKAQVPILFARPSLWCGGGRRGKSANIPGSHNGRASTSGSLGWSNGYHNAGLGMPKQAGSTAWNSLDTPPRSYTVQCAALGMRRGGHCIRDWGEYDFCAFCTLILLPSVLCDGPWSSPLSVSESIVSCRPQQIIMNSVDARH